MITKYSPQFLTRSMIIRFVLIGFLVASFNQVQSQDSLKCWSSVDKLTWSDFKGNVPAKEQQEYRTAVCPHKIFVYAVMEGDILNYKVKISFIRNKAWVTDTSKYLLSHEQLHFDIGELYARKLRKAIEEEKNNKSQLVNYKPMIEKLLEEERKVQDEYDNETVHGIDKESQQEWSKKILIELDVLKAYASTLKECN